MADPQAYEALQQGTFIDLSKNDHPDQNRQRRTRGTDEQKCISSSEPQDYCSGACNSQSTNDSSEKYIAVNCCNLSAANIEKDVHNMKDKEYCENTDKTIDIHSEESDNRNQPSIYSASILDKSSQHEENSLKSRKLKENNYNAFCNSQSAACGRELDTDSTIYYTSVSKRIFVKTWKRILTGSCVILGFIWVTFEDTNGERRHEPTPTCKTLVTEENLDCSWSFKTFLEILFILLLILLSSFLPVCVYLWRGFEKNDWCKTQPVMSSLLNRSSECGKDFSSDDYNTLKTHKWYLDWRPESIRNFKGSAFVYPAFQAGSLEHYFSQRFGPGISEMEEMKYEWLRLRTFQNWPQWAKQYPSQLAKAGFYYSQVGDKVVCFSCGGSIQGWTPEMTPQSEHRQRFPDCTFLSGLVENFPIESENRGMTEENVVRVAQPRENPDCASAGHSSIVQGSAHDARPTVLGTEDSSSGTFLGRMKNEHSRVLTYTMWPPLVGVTPKMLARAGFYYTGIANKVKCAFCELVLEEFLPRNDLMETHRTLSPDCPFVLGQNTGNIPVYPSSSSGSLLPVRDSDMANLGIMSDRPKHPEYAMLQTRLHSFRNWSSTIEQRPEVLAAAGFVYAGMSDCVKCFHCDGGLRNWLPGDDPWVEHARWFPNCSHVKLCKGQEFIDTVEERHPRHNTASSTTNRAAAQTPGRNSATDISTLMNMPATQSALEMGYSRKFVEKGLNKYIRDKGGPSGLTAQSLLEILLELQDNGEMSDANTSEDRGGGARADEGEHTSLRTNTSCKKSLNDESESGEPVDTQSLREKNRELIEQTLCKICLENKMCITFLPCGHLVSCAECAPALRKCPICRSNIKGRVRVYMS